MTAWHNQPPLSRRQARDSARRQGSEPTTGSHQTVEADADSVIPIADVPTIPHVTPGSGRRVQWDPSTTAAEPLSYQTRSGLTAEELADDAAAVSDEAGDSGQPSPSGEPGQSGKSGPPADQPFALRDYSPDRRSSFAPLSAGAPGPWSPPTMSGEADDATPTPAGDGPAAHDPPSPERTMTRRELRLLRERAAAEGEPEPSVIFGVDGASTTTSTIAVSPPAGAPITDSPAANSSAAGSPTIEPQATVPASASEPRAESTLGTEPVEAIIEPETGPTAVDTDGRGPVTGEADIVDAEVVEATPAPTMQGPRETGWFTSEPIASAPVVAAPVDQVPVVLEPVVREPAVPEPAFTGSETSEPVAADAEPIVAEPIVAERIVAEPIVAEPIDNVFTHHEPAAPVVSPAVVSPAVVSPPVVSPAVVSPPVVSPAVVTAAAASTPYGHWSTQGDIDDRATTAETALSRDVGVTTGAITTHALVLPSIPESGDQLLSSLTTSTGEIIVTGSIDLPRSFGSTGVHPTMFDHPDVDAIIDESDRDDSGAESAPVRAVRAVASNSSARAVIEAPAPRKSRLPLVLGIVGGAVLLVAIGVIVTVFAINGV